MAQAINVFLEIGDNQYNVSEMGLVNMTFDRYISLDKIKDTGILVDLDITMFDKTGQRLLSLLQAQSNKVRVQYGYPNNLSQKYTLTMTKFKSNYNNLGVMVSVGAYGAQINIKHGSEVFYVGTRVDKILKVFAERNDWYIGEDGNEEYIDVGDLRLDRTLYKNDDESDASFIMNKLLPSCNRIVSVSIDNKFIDFWDVSLATVGGQTEFHFRKNTERTVPRRVWKYEYGVGTNNSIINLTNTVDQSFLINGLNIQVPMPAADYMIDPESTDAEIQSFFDSQIDAVNNIIKSNGLPHISANEFVWNIEVIPSEDIGTTENYQDIIMERISQTMNIINSIELEVIGNPKIQHLDLVDLRVVNRGEDGERSINIISSSGGSVGGYWRIIGIRETIGESGYTTVLKLVRDHSEIVFKEAQGSIDALERTGE